MSGNKAAGKTSATRDTIRAAIFNAKPESACIEFFGNEIELRQPTMGVVMNLRKMEEVDQTTQMLINYAFVPGTNDAVFEPEDEDGIRGIPFGPDMNRLLEAINKLLGISVEGLEKQVQNAMKSPGDGSSSDSSDVDSSGTAQDGGGNS